MLQACINNVEHAFQADFEDEFWGRVEEFRAIHKGQMTDTVDALSRLIHILRISHITLDEIEITLEASKPPQVTAGVIVEDANPVSRENKPSNQGAPEKARASSNQVGLHCRLTCAASGTPAVARTVTALLRIAGFFRKRKVPHQNQRRYSSVHCPGRKLDSPPYKRSTEMIGTSPSLNPASCALMLISNATAHPTGRASRFNWLYTLRRISLIPVVASVRTQPEIIWNNRLAVRDRICPMADPPSRRPP